MSKLYKLMFGRSKKRMRPIMIDVLHKVENYKSQRENTKGAKCSQGWHEIVPAEPTDTPWKQKTCTVGGNRPTDVPRVGRGRNGWVGKHGFSEHT
jgi:hypothetical protein